MTSGKISRLVADRGFGFITMEDGKDMFFHQTGLELPLEFDKLAGGELVTFEIEQSPKGPRAVRVTQA